MKIKPTLAEFDTSDPNYPHNFMPPAKRTIIAPEGGWKRQAYYAVEVSVSRTNPVHRAIFYTGFLNGNNEGTEPGGYNAIWNPIYEQPMKIGFIHYLKVVGQIDTVFPMKMRHEKEEDDEG